MKSKLDILVVEDTKRHQESSRDLLRGHDITLVDNFDEAVELIGRERYDILLTDMFFPQGNIGQCKMTDRKRAHIPEDLGTYLALYAARRKIPNISIVSDSNHHDNSQTYAMVDLISNRGNSYLTIDTSRVFYPLACFLWKTPSGKYLDAEFDDEELNGECTSKELVQVKDWARALRQIKDNLVE